MNLLIWLPLVLIAIGYTCSWPLVPRMRTYLIFDGIALIVSIVTPLVWLHYGYTTDPVTPEDHEILHWMPLLLPFWTTLFALISLTAIAILRYFLFREPRHSFSRPISQQ